MTHYLALAAVKQPGGDSYSDESDIRRQVDDLLKSHQRDAVIPTFVRRPAPTILAATSDPLFKEGTTSFYGETTNPLPRFDSYQIAGAYAGCLHPAPSGSVEKVATDKLLSVSYNTLPANKFRKNFCPQVLITDREWLSQADGIGPISGNKYQNRIFHEIDGMPDRLLVVIELRVETPTRNASFTFLARS